ncbi:hypothetical protein CEXT_149911 [Caerostris extrusa]|uniref:Uncharacterized protein n=1 Tax=Caerostris extrusa TaxID=172846 RepID=A0AAV4NDL1_CAEEX|nr:hypothetical protein CEXT_149911 [Caerostris extrusa]
MEKRKCDRIVEWFVIEYLSLVPCGGAALRVHLFLSSLRFKSGKRLPCISKLDFRVECIVCSFACINIQSARMTAEFLFLLFLFDCVVSRIPF